MNALYLLLPLDGSKVAEAALPLVPMLGGVKVTLFRAIDPAAAFQEGGYSRATTDASGYIEETAARLRAQGVADVDTLVRDGVPAGAIIDVAAELGVGLIALATHGRTGFDRLVLGSVAEKVIRAAPVSVLAVRGEAPAQAAVSRPFDRILVAHDGSDRATGAIEKLALIPAAQAAALTIFGVVETYGEPEPPGPGGRDSLVERILREEADKLRRRLEGAARRARDLGFVASVEVGNGRPAAKILDAAEAFGATAIALTTHGRSGVSRWALGSVTEHVLRAAPIPLLVCR